MIIRTYGVVPFGEGLVSPYARSDRCPPQHCCCIPKSHIKLLGTVKDNKVQMNLLACRRIQNHVLWEQHQVKIEKSIGHKDNFKKKSLLRSASQVLGKAPGRSHQLIQTRFSKRLNDEYELSSNKKMNLNEVRLWLWFGAKHQISNNKGGYQWPTSNHFNSLYILAITISTNKISVTLNPGVTNNLDRIGNYI